MAKNLRRQPRRDIETVERSEDAANACQKNRATATFCGKRVWRKARDEIPRAAREVIVTDEGVVGSSHQKDEFRGVTTQCNVADREPAKRWEARIDYLIGSSGGEIDLEDPRVRST